MSSSATAFYQSYHGHPPDLLRRYAAAVREGRRIIWLAGDSSLDSKHWVKNNNSPACNGEERALDFASGLPSVPRDVAHSVNEILVERGLGGKYVCINAAVEESRLASREDGLLSQDQVLHDMIEDGDIVIVSVGGNDIALQPSLATAFALTRLLGTPWTRGSLFLGGASDHAIKAGTAGGMSHLIHMFGTTTQEYIRALVGTKRPALVIPCLVYAPLEASAVRPGAWSWADKALSVLGYDANPALLQDIISQIFERATSRITLDEGIACKGCPLFKVLDPKNAKDYEARVEPSAQGGAKMANAFVSLIETLQQ
jgi:hypothetical protein